MSLRIKTFLMERQGEAGTGAVWKRKDTGETYERPGDFPVGAVYRADWYEHKALHWCGPDGKAYIVIIPEHPDGTGRWPWHMDGPASNCTKPTDTEHRCWCRHGEAPDFTVDKNGNTCEAGAGSIHVKPPGGFHGFLRDGFITD